MASIKKPETISEWFEYGRQCFHKPDGLEAVKAFEKVCDVDPTYIHSDGDNPYFYLGKIHEVEGRLKEAVMLYTRALTVDFWDEESLIGRGSCLSSIGKPAEAIEDFKKVVQIPDKKRRSPKKHLCYAIAENYRKLQDWGNAVYWAQQALNLDPGNERHKQLLEKLIAKFQE
jgi:tetratricopeptide (TPR) repeat protein